MTRTTKAQRKAVRAVFCRGPIKPYMTPDEHARGLIAVPLTYKQFRRGVQPTFGCDGAVAVQWAGMWLCIERDGYTHS